MVLEGASEERGKHLAANPVTHKGKLPVRSSGTVVTQKLWKEAATVLPELGLLHGMKSMLDMDGPRSKEMK